MNSASNTASSSVWNAVSSTVGSAATDPTTLLHTQLASALSTLGDAQYWEESIAPSSIRTSLQECDPNSPSSTPELLRGMKWLLAQISKGRDVSDFFVIVVKLVSCRDLEVRKMVYIYIIQYCNSSATTREASLLAINAFQRGLTDASSPLIRALALRVLTSVAVPDVLSIQILAVQKILKIESSVYVRKCAVTAIAKLAGRCCGSSHTNNINAQQYIDDLMELLQQVLDYDENIMVLSSAVTVYYEMTGASVDSLYRLHGSFRKLCHMLTDMDEYGQVVCIDVLTRYCRHFFQPPPTPGSAEQVDAARRVVQRLTRDGTITTASTTTTTKSTAAAAAKQQKHSTSSSTLLPPTSIADQAAAAGVQLPAHSNMNNSNRKIIKRRVVKKAFYSDEEDESTEEEVFADTLLSVNTTTGSNTNRQQPLSAVMRQQPVDAAAMNNEEQHGGSMMDPLNIDNLAEDEQLDPDHRFLLRCALPLLKSRNAGVVLQVCALHYYCGVSSIYIRKALGQALVRIHRSDGVEIQYVVLSSIRALVRHCPSAFLPFLHDFFVLPDMDAPFTRLIKLDILTALALEPASIQTVLTELRTYVQVLHGVDGDDENDDDDTAFVCAAVRAVGRVTEMARIVYDRHHHHHASSSDNYSHSHEDRAKANEIALNCLYGLLTLSVTANHEAVVGEAVCVMQRILQMLQSDNTNTEGGAPVQDPNHVQERALQRIVLLLVNTLSCVADEEEDESEFDDLDDDDLGRTSLERVTLVLPPAATASALWLVGEFLASSSSSPTGALLGDLQTRSKLQLELARLLVRAFIELEASEKEEAVHFASKLLVFGTTTATTPQERQLCEELLALGRLDVNPDVRDRARYESGIIDLSVGLQQDRDALETVPLRVQQNKRITVENAKRILLSTKPASSYLPLEDENKSSSDQSGDAAFRFGTLSSLVGHRARSAYLPLPDWADKNSPSSLREPPQAKRREAYENDDGGGKNGGQEDGFYGSSSTSEDDSSSSTENSASESSGEDASSSSDSFSETDSDNANEGQREGLLLPGTQAATTPQAPSLAKNNAPMTPQRSIHVENASDDSSSGSDEFSSETKSTAEDLFPNASNRSGSLIPMETIGGQGTKAAAAPTAPPNYDGNSVVDDMKGLVLAPVVTDPSEAPPTDTNFDRDSGAWIQLIRPEHASGLSVKARYLRGVTKSQQAQLMGLTSEKPTVVCLQILFENKKEGSGGAPFRHVRILQRSSTSSSSIIGPRKVTLPLEINQLATGQTSECMVGIDFASPSDRDGSLQAKLDVKFGSGGMPVEIKPSLGDLLLPCKVSIDEFDTAVSRMHGFNRVESKISVSEASRSKLPLRLLSRAALTPVGTRKVEWKDDKVRLAGLLPASSDPVYVLVSCGTSGQGKVAVCCDHALAVNAIMNLLKRAIAEQ